MSDGFKFSLTLFAVIFTMFSVGYMFVDNMEQRQLEREKNETAKKMGITQTVVGSVRIICQNGQNCICLDSWSNKQLECKFSN